MICKTASRSYVEFSGIVWPKSPFRSDSWGKCHFTYCSLKNTGLRGKEGDWILDGCWPSNLFLMWCAVGHPITNSFLIHKTKRLLLGSSKVQDFLWYHESSDCITPCSPYSPLGQAPSLLYIMMSTWRDGFDHGDQTIYYLWIWKILSWRDHVENHLWLSKIYYAVPLKHRGIQFAYCNQT